MNSVAALFNCSVGRQLDQFLRYLDSLLNRLVGRHLPLVSPAPHVCLRTGVLECLDDASFHLDFTFVSLVSGHPRPPVVTAPVCRGCPCQDPLGCLRCPGRMASGAQRQPLWLRSVGGGGHVMWTWLIHAFYKQNQTIDKTKTAIHQMLFTFEMQHGTIDFMQLH